MPRLTVTPRWLIVRPATTVALTCAVQPEDGDTAMVTLSDVRWTRDGRELDAVLGHATLVIAHFAETTHGGVYQCSARLADAGRAVSDFATVHAAGASLLLSPAVQPPSYIGAMTAP